ncbi:uncharacterized protein LOC143183351 [Calliopsis andreniformis]|uniref:uncharacterized protein LOC143183351 n=1 Tax=Calliopsis andreniformis TaxID=337506 RepID=UPI003FCED505
MSSNTTPVLLKKRERTQNWVAEEKKALFALIKAHANAIENKKIDAAASAMKNLAWQEIYCAFRGRFSTDRDITRIREQWRRMKAQARMEMYSFAEKVRTLGPEEAVKFQPSNLSIEVWRLIEKARKNDGDGERSEENGQENLENSASLQAILDKLTSSTPEIPMNEIKVEAGSDDYSTEEEASQSELFAGKSDPAQKKRPRLSRDEQIDIFEQKPHTVDDTVRQFDNEEASLSTAKGMGDQMGDREESIQRAMWMLEAAQREHDLKLRTLSIELERAELQKKAAVNELKTSEIKRQLIESQAAEYYRCIHIVSHFHMSIMRLIKERASKLFNIFICDENQINIGAKIAPGRSARETPAGETSYYLLLAAVL